MPELPLEVVSSRDVQRFTSLLVHKSDWMKADRGGAWKKRNLPTTTLHKLPAHTGSPMWLYGGNNVLWVWCGVIQRTVLGQWFSATVMTHMAPYVYNALYNIVQLMPMLNFLQNTICCMRSACIVISGILQGLLHPSRTHPLSPDCNV